MADRPRIYVDASCFIDAAKQAIGILPAGREGDVWHLWKLMDANKEGDVQLFTSILSIAECTHADGVMDDRVRSLFERLLMSGQYVALVQPTPFVAADARDLRWKHGIALRGADYLHVASALDRRCTEFLTRDDKITKAGPKIAALGMTVAAPDKTTLLPDRYRQGSLIDEKVTPIRRPAKQAPPAAG